MMIESLILGFRDLLKYKRLFIMFEIALLLIWMIVISASSSLLSELKISSNAESSLRDSFVVPIKTDMSSNTNLVNEFNQVLNKGGKTFFYSNQVTNKLGVPTVIVLDKNFNKGVNEQNNESSYAKLYATTNVKQKINLSNIHSTEPITLGANNLNGFDERIYENFSKEDLAIILLKTENLNKWIDTKEGLEIMDFVENLNFSKLDKEGGVDEGFDEILGESFMYMQSNTSENTELRFILLFVYPVAALLIASLVLALTIMYGNLFKKFYREYSIHLITGATLKHIFLRNSVFIVILVSICFLFILYLNKFQINLIFWIALVTLTLVFVIFEVVLFTVLKRRNLSIILKGDF